ncbi:TIR domain-containing protein [Aquimarina sp. MMG015]|uniref:TIR domain-containing protein n=1 Tax=unclassified Aquimarina TaxID=2627091 RepID=UPI000E49EDA0|nr:MULTISPECIES: TIR domain-containing protein [unclassified Aquimarina]AXT57559.1 TIR domain-containing protein [Aquimarina sp. AD1]MBQ4805225.1 TIR domain-containing protein [Aquimarina sp. MMG015]RKN34275.1 TIR domain-containing protein [Aquimarina sp. AD1]
MKNRSYEYDVALSFAGENRAYVEKVANSLKTKGVKVFYDLFEEANLWGKNLYEYLSEIYQNKARYTVLFVSSFYNKKLWTNHERVSMQARAFQESREYILPARFDDTEIPGILKTIGYINLENRTPEELAVLIENKLKKDQTFLKNRWSKLSTMISPKPFIFTIKVVDEKSQLIKHAKVVLVANNSTYLEGFTDENGLAHFVIRTRKLYTVLIAHSEYPAVVFNSMNPKEDVEVTIEKTNNSGSIIINKSGQVPGISGKIEPVSKSDKKLLLYADNIAIEGGKDQPYDFELNKSIALEDNKGNIVYLTFRFFQARIALIDFYKDRSM